MSQLGLKDKRVLVTGAAGGLGRAFAEGFAEAGARVIAADLNEAGAQKTARAIRDTGRQALGAGVDVTNAQSCADLAQFAQDSLGGLDALINNAAIYAGLERRNFTDIEEDVWDKVMAVNVKGVWQMTRAATPLLRVAGGGAIVNVASATVFSGSPQWLHYVTSKGAVIAMTRALARELGDDNIRANVLAPGFTLTEASLDLIADARSYGVSRGALKRSAEAGDMVGAAIYLASDLAGFVTGQTLIVDGGRQFN